MRRVRLTTRATGIAALLLAPASQAAGVHDEQVWINATVMQTTPGGLAWFAEVQPRFGDGASEVQQLLLRPAIGWNVSPDLTIYAGYARVVLPRRGAPDRSEDRLFTQISWTMGRIGAGTLSSRTRLEYRELSDGRDEGWRARAMIRYVHPVLGPEKTRALVWAEPFVALNDTDWGARAGFDQLRSFAGVEVPVGGRSTLEIGYLNQFIDDPGPRNRTSHVASVTAFFRL